MCEPDKAITISLKGNPALREALVMLAAKRSLQERRKVGVGELVREAVDQVYGEELQPWLDAACAQPDDDTQPVSATR